MGRAHQAIYLNTENLSYRYVPVQLQNMQLIISCTNKERGLADSKYNLRRMECERALADLQKVVSIRQLGELSMDDFEKYQQLLTMSAEGVQGMLFQRIRGPFRLCRLWKTMI